MLRSIKYGLYGAALAGIVSGTVAWTSPDKTVTLVVDGQRTRFTTHADQVSGVLASAGLRHGAHDIVAPSPGAAIHDGSTIVVKRGRLLHLDVDGTRRDVWTTAPTVAEALAALGYSDAAATTVSRSKRLALSANDITLRQVTVVVDGTKRRVRTTAASAAELLAELDVVLGREDVLSAQPSSRLHANQTLVVRRVLHTRVDKDTSLPFTTKVVKDPTLAAGRTRVAQAGRAGLLRARYAVVYVDGAVKRKTLLAQVVVRKPATRVIKVGTSTATPATPEQAQALARVLAEERGWGGGQFQCLVTLWDHESNWRVHATNPSSGAYGIPQALPASKMGPGYLDSAAVQIRWGLNYIAERYGTPCGAWSTWQAQGSWY